MKQEVIFEKKCFFKREETLKRASWSNYQAVSRFHFTYDVFLKLKCNQRACFGGIKALEMDIILDDDNYLSMTVD